MSDPKNLVIESNVAVPLSAIAQIGNYILGLCDDSSGQLFVFNVFDPKSPYVQVNYIIPQLTNERIHAVLPTKTMKQLIVATGTGIIFLDVSNPLNSIFLSKYTTNEVFSVSLSAGGEYLIATCEKHFEVLSISSPANPSLIDTLEFAAKIQQSIFSLYDSNILVASWNGLEMVQIFRGSQDKMTPSLRSTNVTSINGSPNGFIALTKDDYAYVSDENGGMTVIYNNHCAICEPEHEYQSYGFFESSFTGLCSYKPIFRSIRY